MTAPIWHKHHRYRQHAIEYAESIEQNEARFGPPLTHEAAAVALSLDRGGPPASHTMAEAMERLRP
jgi:hypothetical protein